MAKEMTLQNGTKITVQAVPALLVLAVSERYPRPTPPQWRNEDKGGRLEEYPLDPEYIKASEGYTALIQDKTIDCYLANGVRVQEIGPDVLPLQNDEWLENVEYTLGIQVAKSGVERRVAWLRYHVLDQAEELGDIVNSIAVASGLVSEETVTKAAESFRDNEDGDSNTPVPISSASGFGDKADGVTRLGDGVRVQGDLPLLD